MKKNLFLCLFAALCTMGTFTACSSDDEPGVTTPAAADVTGNYKGNLDVKITQGEMEIPGGKVENQLVSVTKAGESTVSLSISDFSFMGIQIGDINLNDCQLSGSGDKYTFTGTTKVNAVILTADVEAEGTFEGDKLTINMDIDASVAGQKQTVKVVYTGTKLTGSESSEAKILSFVFDQEVSAANAVVLEQPVVDETAKTIKFAVSANATSDDLSKLMPTIEVSEKATVTPASGAAQDFSNGKTVTYTVTAENGTKVTYTASISANVTPYDFENWVAGVEDTEGLTPDMIFYNPEGWCSSNAGAQLLKAFKLADSYVVEATNDAHSGENAVSITSIDTKGKDTILAKVPKVTTGSLFLGSFITDMSSTLNSTKFGIPYSAKAVSLKGWYKYTPGAEFYVVNEQPYAQHCHEAVLDETKTDEFMISIVVYETNEFDTEGWSDCLTGDPDSEKNIYTSSRVAAIAQLTGGKQDEWKEFELPLEWKKEYSADKKYRMAIICSASKDGDKFWGAPGSKLIVDDFKLIAE